MRSAPISTLIWWMRWGPIRGSVDCVHEIVPSVRQSMGKTQTHISDYGVHEGGSVQDDLGYRHTGSPSFLAWKSDGVKQRFRFFAFG